MLFDESSSPPVEVEAMPEFEIEPVPEIPLPDVSIVVEKREELRELVDEEGFLVESGTRVGDAELSQEDGDSDYWAVQLASFGDEGKANTLREQLQSDGQPTWISQAKVNDLVVTRVAIGPFDNREDADQARTDLSSQYELDAVVVAYRP